MAKLFHSIPKFCQPTGRNPIQRRASAFSPWINISHLAKLTANQTDTYVEMNSGWGGGKWEERIPESRGKR